MNKLFPDGDVPVKQLSSEAEEEDMSVVKTDDGTCIPLCKLSELQCSESKNNGAKVTENNVAVVVEKLNKEKETCSSPVKEVVLSSEKQVGVKPKDFVPNNQQALLSQSCDEVKGHRGECSSSREYKDEGTREWEHYLDVNQSCIVDAFQGQFKSTVSKFHFTLKYNGILFWVD